MIERLLVLAFAINTNDCRVIVNGTPGAYVARVRLTTGYGATVDLALKDLEYKLQSKQRKMI